MSCSKKSETRAGAEHGVAQVSKRALKKEDLSYDFVAAKAGAISTPARELGDRCSDFVIGESKPAEERKSIPKTVGGVFRHFEKSADSKNVDCKRGEAKWNCRIEVSVPDDYSAQLRFELDDSGAILSSSIECSLAG